MAKSKISPNAIIWVFGICAILLTANQLGYLKGNPAVPATTGGTGAGTTGGTQTINLQTSYNGQNTIDVVTRDKYNPTLEKDICCITWVNGARLTDIATTGTGDITANVGEHIKLICGQDDVSNGDYNCGVTTTENNSVDWYWTTYEFDALAKEQQKVELEVVAEDATRPTVTVLDSTGLNQVDDNATGTNQTIAAGKVYSLKVWYSDNINTCYGTPKAQSGLSYTGVLCARYNLTGFDDVQMRAQGSSEEFAIAPRPTEFTTSSLQKAKCWYITDEHCDGVDVYYSLLLDMDDSAVPPYTEISFAHYDVGGYMHLNQNAFYYGVEDEQSNDVGQTTDLTWYVTLHT